MRALHIIAFLLINYVAFSQNITKYFTLNDSTAELGSVCVIKRYDPYSGIDSVVRFLNRNPNVKMEISSYTNPTTGQMCSSMPEPAKDMVNYLIARGIESARLLPQDWGAFNPIIPLSAIDTMKTWQEKNKAYERNERIELRIIGIDSNFWHKTNPEGAEEIIDTVIYGIHGSYPQMYYKKYNISEAGTMNGDLIVAQRTNAIFDKYINLDYGMEADMPGRNKNSNDSNSIQLQLSEIMGYLKINKKTVIEVLEYADLRYGQICGATNFSSNRVNSIVNYMITQGIEPKRFIAAGFGYDEDYVMPADDGIFKKGDTLTGLYIANLKSEKDKIKAYSFRRRKQVEVIVLPEKK